MAATSPIQVVVIVFALFALSRTVLRFKDSRLGWRALVLWSLIWLAVIVIAISPEVSKRVAENVGIGRGVDLLIYLSILALFYLVFRIYVRLEQTDQNLSKVVTQIALNKPKKPGTGEPA